MLPAPEIGEWEGDFVGELADSEQDGSGEDSSERGWVADLVPIV